MNLYVVIVPYEPLPSGEEGIYIVRAESEDDAATIVAADEPSINKREFMVDELPSGRTRSEPERGIVYFYGNKPPEKSQKVGEVRSSNHEVRLPVMLDRNRLLFFVEVPGYNRHEDDVGRVEAASVEEVKKLAVDLLDRVVPYDWQPIITIEMELPEGDEKRSYWRQKKNENDVELKFLFERMEVSPAPVLGTDGNRSKVKLRREHTLDFENGKPDKGARQNRDRNEGLGRLWETHKAAIIPYDQAVWDGLCAMRDAVNDAKSKLQTIVGSKDVGRIATMKLPPMLPDRRST